MEQNQADSQFSKFNEHHIVVVIPCYQVADRIGSVIDTIPNYIRSIIAVNDFSTDETGNMLDTLAGTEPRLRVIQHTSNQGVGAATISGYTKALELGADVVIKMDGDGQMDPSHFPSLITPILSGEADYTKGNRFHNWRFASSMPFIRKFGNLGLSLLIKVASGYWSIFDPTNGFTAISSQTFREINHGALKKRYLFETSMLIELYDLPAVIHQFPMDAVYDDAPSSLSILDSLFRFPPYLVKSFIRRFVRKYIFQDFGAVTIFVFGGIFSLLFGVIFGTYHWLQSIVSGAPATAGTVLISAVPTILGFQLLLQALVLDIQNDPGGSR